MDNNSLDDETDRDSFEEFMLIQDHLFLYMQELHDEEEETAALASAALLIYADEEVRSIRNRRRARNRQYLIRADLLPNPRRETPWQVLYENQNPRAFITTMGFDPPTFQSILAGGFEEIWVTRAISRSDVTEDPARIRVPRPERRSLDAPGALGLLLHYLSSTMLDVSLSEIFALIPTSVYRYITFALPLLLGTLRHMKNSRIAYPEGDQFQELNSLIVARHPRLTGAFGSMDGLNLPVQTSTDQDIENATYNGWLHDHFVSNVFAFGADGVIIACHLNAPGSWHDSRVAQPIYTKLHQRTPDGYYLVTDTAFPQGAEQIAGHIRAPLKTNARLPSDENERAELLSFNRELLSYRQTAEWGMRALQGSFGRLRIPLPINYSDFRADLLETVARLHNLRTRSVGINQIRSVYSPMWTEEEETWLEFRGVAFSEVRRNDRVLRFHHHVDQAQ